MSSQLAAFVTGVAPCSLGATWLAHYCQNGDSGPVIAVDRVHDQKLDSFGNVYPIVCDLNRLAYADEYSSVYEELRTAVGSTPASIRGISTAVLSAGTYESGRLVDMDVEARKRLIGVNICGQIETLHMVLSLNQRLDIDSSSCLSYVQIGSLHGLRATRDRSVYAASKAFGLELCLSLTHGEEVKRAIYVAPGPIDTPMLHRNHWVSKVNGPIEFYEQVLKQGQPIYQDVFVRCVEATFREAVSGGGWALDELADKYDQYMDYRFKAFSQPEGVLAVTELAEQLTNIVKDDASFTGGVYVFTSPSGQITMDKLSFDEMVRY